MKKILLAYCLLLLLFMPCFAYADVSVSGTGIKQVGKTLTQADDITKVVFKNMSVINCSNCGGVSTLQEGYVGGSTITTDVTRGALTIKDGGSGVIQKWVDSTGRVVFAITSGFKGLQLVNAYQNITGIRSTSLSIPGDTTRPQITEGGMFLNISTFPTMPDSDVRIYGHLAASWGVANQVAACALFRDSETDALVVSPHYSNTVGTIESVIIVDHLDENTGGEPHWYQIRCGAVAGTFYLNAGYTGVARYGGSLKSFMRGTEISK
jgi:hypothetical protein